MDARNPFPFKRFPTLSIAMGVYPLLSGMSSDKKSLGNWRFDSLNSPSFHFSPSTGHGLRNTVLQPLRAPLAQKELTNCAFSSPERKGVVLATPLPRENSGRAFHGGEGGMTCTNHKPRPAMIKKEGRRIALQTEPQRCGKLPARSGKEVPISLSADGVGAAGAPRGGAGAFGSAV